MLQMQAELFGELRGNLRALIRCVITSSSQAEGQPLKRKSRTNIFIGSLPASAI